MHTKYFRIIKFYVIIQNKLDKFFTVSYYGLYGTPSPERLYESC